MLTYVAHAGSRLNLVRERCWTVLAACAKSSTIRSTSTKPQQHPSPTSDSILNAVARLQSTGSFHQTYPVRATTLHNGLPVPADLDIDCHPRNRRHSRRWSARLRRLLRLPPSLRPRVPQVAEEAAQEGAKGQGGGGQGRRAGPEGENQAGRRRGQRGWLPQRPRGD